MVNTGRWQEYKVDEAAVPMESDFDPKRDACEVLDDPGLLQRMFFRELRACRLEPTANPAIVRWGVRDGTRDPGTGRFIHDDLVMSAAMAVFDEDDLPVSNDPGWGFESCGVIDPEFERMMSGGRNTRLFGKPLW